MKRILSIVLIALTLCNAFVLTGCAETAVSPRASYYFTSYGINLAKQSDGRIKITFDATGTDVCSQLGVATYQIQQKNSSGEWVDYGDLYSGKTATNVTSYTFSKYFTPVSGKTYRVKCTFICTINNGTESKAYTSGSIKG